MVFGLESTFGGGLGTHMETVDDQEVSVENKWISPPPNTHFQSTHNRNVTLYTAMGTKTWEVATYGQFQGQWSWTFILDYEYLEPFFLAFDSYHYDEQKQEHVFRKCNAKRVKSFCIRRKIMNRVAGGTQDEAEVLVGCIVTDISFSRSAGSGSQIQVSMSGLYAYETMDNTDLIATDYSAYNGDPVEYACVYAGGLDGEHIEYVDQLGIQVGNGASMVYGICTPFPLNYSEGSSNYSISLSAYSNEPKRFKKRLYSGGYDNRASRPWAKDLQPMDKMTVIAYDKSRFNEYFDGPDDEEPTTYETMQQAIEASTKTVTFTMEKIIIKSMQWQNGDGSKLMDQVSGTNARKLTMAIKNDKKAAIDMGAGGWHPLETRPVDFDYCGL